MSIETSPRDPRPRHTRDLLGDALVQLIQEKAFDDIIIQEVLDRAGVGRTTFYTHFLHKQDLFLSDAEDFLEGMASLLDRRCASSHRVAPVEEFFAHAVEAREFYRSLDGSGKIAEIRELGIGIFAKSIARRLTAQDSRRSLADVRATAHALAGAMFAMLEWWIQSPNDLTPFQMDALFHRMVKS